MLVGILKLFRPLQWTKNLLVFAALLFTGSFDARSFELVGIAFAAMCLASSAIYVLNDLRDAERDRLHPKKKNRPIASGQVPPAVAGFVGLLAGAGALALGAWLGVQALAIVAAYFGLQALYNFGMKSIPVADVFLIALGFVLRAFLGGAALRVDISGWLFFCTMSLALMLGFSKRRDEYRRMGEDRASSRASLAGYSMGILDLLVGVFAGAAILSYGIYSIESPTARQHPGLMATALFVTYGISRYLYREFHEGIGEEPETVLVTDPHILFSVLGFLVVAALAMADVFGTVASR